MSVSRAVCVLPLIGLLIRGANSRLNPPRTFSPNKEWVCMPAWRQILGYFREKMSLTQKVVYRFSWKVKENHPRMLIHHPTKNEVNPTYSLGGVWQNTHTHTHRQTHTHTHIYIYISITNLSCLSVCVSLTKSLWNKKLTWVISIYVKN